MAEEANKLGCSPSTLKGEIKKARASKKAAELEPEPTPEFDVEELQEQAAVIIESDDVLGLFEKAWNRAMAGEQRNAKLLYLVVTTRLFPRCMSAGVKGPSSAGKSEVRKGVLNFIPPEDIISFTTLSEKSLLYYEADFCHKILSMGEAAGSDEQQLQDYLLRELISSGKLEYPVVQKIGNELITVKIEKNGPVCFLVTTTKAALHPENETRMLSIEVDDSGAQTSAVLAKVAEIVGLNAEKTAIHYDPWHAFQRWLAAGNTKVVVPFARELGQLIPPRSVRLRRDFSQLLLAIKAHALLHRAHRPVDNRDQIIADLDLDYLPVVSLMGAIVAEASGTGVSPELQATIDAVTKATATISIDQGATSDKIAKLLKLDQSSAWRRLRVAENKGYIVNLETRHRQPGKYRVTTQEVEAEPLLPSPAAIRERMATPVHTAQTRKRVEKGDEDQDDSVCASVCMPNAYGDEAGTVCNGRAYGQAYANPIENTEESASVCTNAPYAQGAGSVCAACNGLGCPSCIGLTAWTAGVRKSPKFREVTR